MYEFLKNLYDRGNITAKKVWSYCPKFITEEEANKITGGKKN